MDKGVVLLENGNSPAIADLQCWKLLRLQHSQLVDEQASYPASIDIMDEADDGLGVVVW